jgi:hypothetical protein
MTSIRTGNLHRARSIRSEIRRRKRQAWINRSRLFSAAARRAIEEGRVIYLTNEPWNSSGLRWDALAAPSNPE